MDAWGHALSQGAGRGEKIVKSCGSADDDHAAFLWSSRVPVSRQRIISGAVPRPGPMGLPDPPSGCIAGRFPRHTSVAGALRWGTRRPLSQGLRRTRQNTRNAESRTHAMSGLLPS
jgi:hypothetical protein